MKNVFHFLFALLLLCLSTPGLMVGQSQDDELFELKKNFEIFGALYQEIIVNYVDHIRPQPFMKSGIDAMMDRLDPYTRYYDEADNVDQGRFRRGTLGDVGLSIGIRDGRITVLAPEDNAEAYRRGIRTGDRILSVSGVSTEGLTVSDVASLLRGEPGTRVDLSIARSGRPGAIRYTLIRAVPPRTNVSYAGFLDADSSQGIAYIRLELFGNRAAREVRRVLRSMHSSGMLKGLILDLRNNPGGILSEAIELVGLFVPAGTTVVSTRGRLEENVQVFRTEKEPLLPSLPVTVLVNGFSASASEIVAGSLQDLDRAVIIGEPTFGKGLVQTVRSLPYNTSLKITVAHYFIPSGRDIQSKRIASAENVPVVREYQTVGGRPVRSGLGIEPDISVAHRRSDELEQALDREGAFFRFADDYSVLNTVPQQVETNSEHLLSAFRGWLQQQSFSYETEADIALEALAARLKSDGISDSGLDEIRNRIETAKSESFEHFSDRILERIRAEVRKRYLSKSEQITASLQNDPAVERAKSLVTDRDEFSRILK